MAINYLEIVLQTALFAAVLAAIGAYVRYRAFPKLKAEAGNWAGAAIGRFWQTLSEKAGDEEEGSGGSSSPAGGAFNIAGFKIDAETIRSAIQMWREIKPVLEGLGLFKGGTGGTANPFVK